MRRPSSKSIKDGEDSSLTCCAFMSTCLLTLSHIKSLMQTQTLSPKPPVILQVLPALRSGGVERGTIDIARAITQAGAKSLVASAGGPMAHQLHHAGAQHFTLPLYTRNP